MFQSKILRAITTRTIKSNRSRFFSTEIKNSNHKNKELKDGALCSFIGGFIGSTITYITMKKRFNDDINNAVNLINQGMLNNPR